MKKLGVVILNYMNYQDDRMHRKFFKAGISRIRNCYCG